MFIKTKRINNAPVHRAMIRNVVDYVFSAANMGVTGSIAAFEAGMTTLEGKLAAIDALYASRSGVLTGIAVQKKLARKALGQTSFSIMSAVRAYSIDRNDQATAQDMKVALSVLSSMPYQKLVDRIASAIAVVEPLVADLGDYNITDADITNWTNELTALSNLLTGSRNAIAGRKVINAQIQHALLDAMAYLKGNGDTTAALFMESNPAFYAGYVANRKLIHTATVPVTPALRIYIKNEAGMAITQGEVIIPSTDKSAVLDANGHAFIERIPVGPQMITVTTPYGPSTSYGPFDFVEKHIVKLSFQISTSTEGKAKVTKEKVVEVASEANVLGKK